MALAPLTLNLQQPDVASISLYDHFVELFGDNTIDLDDDVFKAELYTNAHVFAAANTQRSQISVNALATGNGYTNPGQNLSAVTWAHTGGVTTFDAADVVWTASGGPIGPARYCVVYDDTTISPLDALCFEANLGSDGVAGDGADFSILWNASGIFTVS